MRYLWVVLIVGCAQPMAVCDPHAILVTGPGGINWLAHTTATCDTVLDRPLTALSVE